MEKINVRFPEKQVMQISDLMSCLGLKQSEVARAALSLGMNQIKELAARDIGKASELVILNDAKAKQ